MKTRIQIKKTRVKRRLERWTPRRGCSRITAASLLPHDRLFTDPLCHTFEGAWHADPGSFARKCVVIPFKGLCPFPSKFTILCVTFLYSVGVTETVICIQDFATSLINNIFSLLKRMGNKLATRSHLDRSDQRRYMFSDPLPTCPLTPKSPLSPLLDSILPKISHLKSDHSFLTIGNHRILIRNNS